MLPILGLSDIVIFPGMVAPLLVETAQSTKLIDDVVGGDRLLGVVLQRNAEAENPLPHEMHEVGCAARVLKMLKFPDNTVRVLVEGLWRIQIKEYPTTEPYLCAKFELVQDLKEDSVELTAMMRNAQSQFQEIIKLSPALSEQIKIAALNTEEPGHFADLIAVNLNLTLEERQKLLETNSVKERLTRLLPMLNREHEVLTLSSKIQSEVATSISKTQRQNCHVTPRNTPRQAWMPSFRRSRLGQISLRDTKSWSMTRSLLRFARKPDCPTSVRSPSATCPTSAAWN